MIPWNRPHVLLGATGSVASLKIPELAANLSAFAEVKVFSPDVGHGNLVIV